MSQYVSVPNLRRRYIMTIVDYFSGKVWARAITNRNNNPANPTLSNAINDVCVNEAHTFPHIVQVDNEFSAGSFLTWCTNHNVLLIATSPYTPNSNGKVERMNREIASTKNKNRVNTKQRLAMFGRHDYRLMSTTLIIRLILQLN